jgi:hypothetical protein
MSRWSVVSVFQYWDRSRVLADRVVGTRSPRAPRRSAAARRRLNRSLIEANALCCGSLSSNPLIAASSSAKLSTSGGDTGASPGSCATATRAATNTPITTSNLIPLLGPFIIPSTVCPVYSVSRPLVR